VTSAGCAVAAVAGIGVAGRIAALDWERIVQELDGRGWALTGPLLSVSECEDLTNAYDDEGLYRSRVVMARHNFGRGEYKYYDYPLPELIERLRREVYPHLVPVANRWARAIRSDLHYAKTLSGMLRRCREAGQTRPTPLILRYGKGDYNCLHQDLYGDVVFPIQLAVLLSQPEEDFLGGELVLTEQRARMQSRAHVVPLSLGEAVLFATSQRPARGKRGYQRASMRHGVSTLRDGHRHTLGVIFHDAG